MVCAPSLALARCCRHAFYAPRYVMGPAYVCMLADCDAHSSSVEQLRCGVPAAEHLTDVFKVPYASLKEGQYFNTACSLPNMRCAALYAFMPFYIVGPRCCG